MKIRILYPHNLDHPGYDLEPIVALQSEKTIVFLVKNHRIGGQLDLFGIVKFKDFLGWYPVFILAHNILKSMIEAPFGKIYRIQNEFDQKSGQWKMVEFKKSDMDEAIDFILKYPINFNVLKSTTGYIINNNKKK
jgi:hypothetical protein